MRRLYSNPNDRFRTIHTERIVSMSQLEGPLTRAELDAIDESRRKLDVEAQKRWNRRYYNRGHILSVVKHMRYVRECLKIGMLPYGVPKKVMATVFALRLV